MPFLLFVYQNLFFPPQKFSTFRKNSTSSYNLFNMNNANDKNEQASRRNFLKSSVLASAGFMIVPRHVLGKGFVAPSDKLNIAAVGCGGKADFNDLSNTGGLVNAYDAVKMAMTLKGKKVEN